jgi:hypothetical protein
MSTLLKNLLQEFFTKQDNWKIKLLSEFPDIIGENLKQQVSILNIFDHTIVLGVHNSCLMHELSTLTSLLLKKINQTLDIPRIHRIQFKLRGQTYVQKSSMVTTQYNSVQCDVVVLSDQDKKPLSSIQDKALVHALEAYAKRCYREAQWKKE